MRHADELQFKQERGRFRNHDPMGAIKLGPGQNPGGRPSKGDRHVLTARVPTTDAVEAFRVAEALGTSVSQILAELLHEALPRLAAEAGAIRGQGELPIQKAS